MQREKERKDKNLLPSVFQFGRECDFYGRPIYEVFPKDPDGIKCAHFEPKNNSKGLACYYCVYYPKPI
jgi:hypothetical protein